MLIGRPAPTNALHYSGGLTPHGLLLAIFISTVTIKGCDCCLGSLARANIISVVWTAAAVHTYLQVCWDIKLCLWSWTVF